MVDKKEDEKADRLVMSWVLRMVERLGYNPVDRKEIYSAVEMAVELVGV